MSSALEGRALRPYESNAPRSAVRVKDGPKSTRELADYIVAAKGFPGADRHLKTSIAYRIVQALRMQEKRGRTIRDGKAGNALVWKLR